MTGVLLSVIAHYRLRDRLLGERDVEYAEWIHIDLEADEEEEPTIGKKEEGRERGYAQRAIDASVGVLQDLRDVVRIDNVSRLLFGTL